MPQENTENFLAGPDNKKELWKRLEEPRIDLQIRKRKWGLAGPYTEETVRRYSQASPRVEPAR